jgi:hypothetical protein
MFSFTQSGAKLKLVINNQTFGIVTSFNYSIDYGRKALRGIDNPFPQEMVTGQQTVRGSVGCLRLQGTSLESYGVVSPQTSVDSLEFSPMMSDKYISITLVDILTSEIVFRLDMASVMNQQWSVQARGLMQGSFEFEGIVSGETV